MQWSVRNADKGTGRRGKDLAEESAAFLSGRYAEYLEIRHRPVPDWAWLSVLAHGSRQQLRALVDENVYGRGTRTTTTAWWQAVGFLAGEILFQRDEGDLDELRRSVLVPLELEMMASGRQLRRPGEIAKRVLDALDQYPSSRRR